MSVLPIDSLETPRFCSPPTFMRLLLATSLDAAIIGLPSDSSGPFRTGALFAPNAVRALHGIDLVGCDGVEADPPYDGPGQITALPAATAMVETSALLESGHT